MVHDFGKVAEHKGKRANGEEPAGENVVDLCLSKVGVEEDGADDEGDSSDHVVAAVPDLPPERVSNCWPWSLHY
jgi:hypothetical protein